jgi:large subunit ribosomal protein L18
MIKQRSRKERRDVRHIRVKRKALASLGTPRLTVFKSSKHIYAQVIDDVAEQTLVAASSLTPKVREILKQDHKKKIEVAKIVGKYIGELSLSKGIKTVRFDRGGYPYHGRVKSLADGAREAGLKF